MLTLKYRASLEIGWRQLFRSFTTEANGPTAIVFMNMGGPERSADTHDFLLRLFQDETIIPLGPFQKQLGKFIADRRFKKIAKHYDDIGGGSPLRRFSEAQAQQMCKALDEKHPKTAPHLPFVAFRYAPPFADEVYEKLMSQGVRRAVAFSQYPQYSFSTTSSNLKDLRRVQVEMDPENTIQWSYILRWPTQPSFVRAIANNVETALKSFPQQDRDKVMILFSAHSLPMSIVNMGDPYVAEVGATSYAVMQQLKFCSPYRITWQSKVGPVPWLGPQTERAVKALEQHSTYKGSVVVPVAFTSDHIETLHEIDIELKNAVKRPDLVARAPCLNLEPLFIQALTEIVVDHLDQHHANEVRSGVAIHPNFSKLN